MTGEGLLARQGYRFQEDRSGEEKDSRGGPCQLLP